MSLEDRRKQGKALARWLWTGLTGTADELRDLGVEAYEDVRRQVTERNPKRVLNEGHTISPPKREERR
jgi:hypothetical protein